MDTPEDIAREEGLSDLIDQVSKEAVDQFAFDRLRSYYLGHPDVAVNAISTFREAEKLQDTSPTAALVLYTTSIELGLKAVLLKPVVYGLVHNESVANLVSDLAVKQNGIDRFKLILASILAEYGEIDFNAFKVEGRKTTIWEDITHLQIVRNSVVHRGETASVVNAALARTVATLIFGSFFVSVLQGLGLEYAKGGRITNAYSVQGRAGNTG
jgi:hypothetical protein